MVGKSGARFERRCRYDQASTAKAIQLLAGNGKPATKEQVNLVVKKLSAKEQAFYAEHSRTR